MHLARSRPNSPLLRRLAAVVLLCAASAAWPETLPEYGIKAGFLYNFTTYTEWPDSIGRTITLCVYGDDPFGHYLDELQGKQIGDRTLALQRVRDPAQVDICNVVFITRSAQSALGPILDRLSGKPVLTVADTPGASRRGVAINMTIQRNRVAFEANLAAARANGLNLSARLLRLASDVIQ